MSTNEPVERVIAQLDLPALRQKMVEEIGVRRAKGLIKKIIKFRKTEEMRVRMQLIEDELNDIPPEQLQELDTLLRESVTPTTPPEGP
jgi:hypothetical protein